MQATGRGRRAPAGDGAKRRPRRRDMLLCDAARTVLAGGAPDTGACPARGVRSKSRPLPADRPVVLFELGNAEHEIGDAAATGHLREAGETAADPMLRAHAVAGLAWTTHPDARRQRGRLPVSVESSAAEGRGPSTTSLLWNSRPPDSERC